MFTNFPGQRFLERLAGLHPPTVVDAGGIDLDAPIYYFTPADPLTTRSAREGTQIFGATGSGKTSGSGQALAKAFLSAGFGGLVLTASDDDVALWRRYAQETGRQDDMIFFGLDDEALTFDFMQYEYSRGDSERRSRTENLVNLFVHNVLDVAGRGRAGGTGEAFWQEAKEQIIRNAIDLVTLALDRATLQDIYRCIRDAPRDLQQTHSEEWLLTSFCSQLITSAENKDLPPARKADLEMTRDYWLHFYPELDARPKSIVNFSFSSLADRFLRSPIRELLCSGNVTVPPDLSNDGKVIVLSLPYHSEEGGHTAQLFQVLYKFFWQQAMSRRSADAFPAFLWVDESQLFISRSDMTFQSTARGNSICTVYLTQNLSNYYSELGGRNSRDVADALLGHLNTKIFHANTGGTNDWASRIIGQDWQDSPPHVTVPLAGEVNLLAPSETNPPRPSVGMGKMIGDQVMPVEFTRLRRGGPINDYCVDAIIFQGGKLWNYNDRTYLPMTFLQR